MNKTLTRILWILNIVLIIAQVVIAAAFTKGDTSALLPLADAAKVQALGGFDFSAPVMSLWGFICRISGIPLWTLAMQILPVLVIPLSYAAYLLLARKVNREYAPLTLLLICLLQIYGYQSELFVPYTLLLAWFGGRAILLHVICPLAAYGLIVLREKMPEQSEEPSEDSEMKNKFLNVRNISIAIVVFALAVASALFILNRKINNLYNATVNLQKSVDEKGSFIEFRGADGEEVKGYVLVNEGSVTVIFGGGREDGAALFELVTKYSDHVDSWYLKRDGDNGAYDYCDEQMLKARKVYKIQGIDEVK